MSAPTVSDLLKALSSKLDGAGPDERRDILACEYGALAARYVMAVDDLTYRLRVAEERLQRATEGSA